jgi:predicted RND superfamily exporter protein
MAFPIASAAFTTFASACVLFFCTITFFQKFGTIVMISMVCALCVSLAFYVALLSVLGPEGSFGNIRDFKNMCSCKPTKSSGPNSSLRRGNQEEQEQEQLER